MKLNNSQLLLILFGVIVIVFAIRFLNNKKEKGTIKSSFFDIDTAAITQFKISPMADKNDGFSLIKSGNVWMIEKEGMESFRVSDEAIARALDEFTKLIPSRLASEDEQSWSKYEVDTAGTLLEIFSTEGSEKIVIGKMIFQNQSMVNSYVRLMEEKEVYACECYLEGTFKNPLTKWRNKQNIPVPMGFWQDVNISENHESVIQLSRNESSWLLHGFKQLENDLPLIKSIDGFNQLSLSAQQEGMHPDSFIYSVDISGDSKSKTHLDLYRNGYKMGLSSPQNPGNYFQIDSSSTATLIQEIIQLKEAGRITPLAP